MSIILYYVHLYVKIVKPILAGSAVIRPNRKCPNIDPEEDDSYEGL